MTRLVQIAQHADDLDRAAACYERLLGSPPTGRFDAAGLLFFDLEGVRLLLGPEAPSTTLYLAVPDIDAAIARLRADGLPVESEPHLRFEHTDDSLGPAGSAEWHAFVRDSEGNLVGLIEQRPGALLPRHGRERRHVAHEPGVVVGDRLDGRGDDLVRELRDAVEPTRGLLAARDRAGIRPLEQRGRDGPLDHEIG